MHIEEVIVRVVEHKWKATIGPPTLRTIMLTIRTNEAVEGHTFLGNPGSDAVSSLTGRVRQMLVGRDPLDIGDIWVATGAPGIPPEVQGAVDVALWDIAGKIAGLPLHRMLGSVRTKAPAYTSSWVHQGVDAYLDEAAAYVEQGFRGHKLHPLTQLRSFAGQNVPVTADIQLSTRVREVVGDDVMLALDSAWAYDYPEAIAVGHVIQELNYRWYEDPLAADDLYGYKRLKQQLWIPVMATERLSGGLTALAPWVVERATDYLRGDVAIKGGVTGMMKIGHLAEAFHLRCEVHDGYNSLNNLASLHVIMALPTSEWFEVLVPHAPGVHDLSHLNWALSEPIKIDADGFAHAPTGAGLGIEPDWDYLDAHTISVL